MRARSLSIDCATRLVISVAALCAPALSACVVSDFDRVRQAATPAEAGACVDAGDTPEEGCEPEDGLDAALDERELDAGLQDDPEGGPAREAGSVDAQADASQLAEGGGEDAPSASSALMCGDTVSDPKNCGRCGVDCSAGAARVSCENGRCYRACQDGFGDCNGDLVLGMMGNGCEQRIDNDIAHCGECRRRCVAPKNGFVTCAKQQCNGHRLLLSQPVPGQTFGSVLGGAAYDLQCPEGEVVTGIEGIGDIVAYGLAARCASLRVTQESGQLAVSLGAVTTTPAVGGLITGPPPSYRLVCPLGMVVSAVSGTLWNYPGATVSSVKTLTITCSGLRVTDQKVALTGGTSLTIGTPEAAPLATFTRTCPAPGAVSGFSGHAGAYIDAIAVHCGSLALQEEVAGSVSVAERVVSAESLQTEPAP